MGRFKKQKKRSNKLTRPGSDEADESLRNEKILPIIAKLKSADFRDRVVAMSAVNSMVDDQRLRELLLREKLLQVILSHSLSDASQEIVAEGFGLLRNVVIEQGRDSAVYLYRQNILATIKSTAEKLFQVWQQNERLTKLKGQDQSIVREFIENVIGLTSSLALADDEIYDAVSETVLESLTPFLHELLESKFTMVTNVILELLHIMSEDSKGASIIVNSGLGKLVSAGAGGSSVTAEVYRLGITYNLIEISHNGTETDLLEIMKNLYAVVEKSDLSQVLPPPPEISSEPKKLKDAVLESAKVRSQINANQVSFEIFASIMESSSHLTEPSEDYVSFIGEKIAPLCITAIKYPNYELRASSTLNNIGWTFNLLQIEWNPLAEQVWAAVLPLLTTEDVTLLTSVVGLLAAISQLFGGHVPLQENDLQELLNACLKFRPNELNVAFEDTKDYLQLLKAFIPFVCSVGAVVDNKGACELAAYTLLSVIESPKECTPDLMVEAINGVFDLFGDNESPNDSVYNEKDVNSKLVHLKPEIKRVLKSINKNDSILREQADETLLNLDRFIEYKAEIQGR